MNELNNLKMINRKGSLIKFFCRKIFSFLLIILSDIVTYYCVLTLALYSRKFLNNFLYIEFNSSFYTYYKTLWIPLLLIIFILFEGLYVKRLPLWDEIGKLIKIITVSMVIVFAMMSLTKISLQYSRLTLFLLWTYSLIFFPFSRFIVKNILYRVGIWKEQVLILGDSPLAISAAKGFIGEKHFGYYIVGFLSNTSNKIGEDMKINGCEIPIIGSIDDVERLVDENRISRIIVALPGLSSQKLSRLISTVQKYVSKIIIVPDSKGVPTLNTELFHLFQEQLFLLNVNNNLKQIQNRFLKRGFDIVLGIIVLPLILLFLSVIYVFIKFDSKGNVFYTQERIGRKGKLFKFIKLRTMYLNNDEILEKYLMNNKEKREEWEKYKKLKDYDPRVTKIGKLLRKTSLDEIAQIFNILKGDMSFIGPRPYLPREIEDMDLNYNDIILARPGISGLWQISGRNKLTFDDRLKLDSWYIANWSLWLDVEILLKTFKVVLKREGAY